jgi:hypothetical protein
MPVQAAAVLDLRKEPADRDAASNPLPSLSK